MTEASKAPGPVSSGRVDLDGRAARHWQPRGWAQARFLVLALLALLLTGGAISQLAARYDWVPDGPHADKLALLRHDPGADIYFVGTSRTLRAVDPTIVDAALVEAGCDGRSLNLGSGGASISDMAQMIDRIGAQAAGSVVVTEGGGMRAAWAKDDGTAERRERHASGLAYLDIVLAEVTSSGGDWWIGLVQVVRHLDGELGSHRLHDALLQRGLGSEPDAPPLQGRGFEPFQEQEMGWARERRAKFLSQLEALARPKVDQGARAALARRSPDLAAAAQALVARIRATGNRPVLLLLPALSSLAAISARNAVALDPTLPVIDLAYDQDPLPFPDPDYFFDQGHVTRLGAAVLSREIGLRLCGLLQGGL